MTLDELRSRIRTGAPTTLEVHALSPMIYVAFEASGRQREPITDGGTTALHFRSRFAALEALRNAGVTTAKFIHRSAYDEMIGQPAGPESVLEETVKL